MGFVIILVLSERETISWLIDVRPRIIYCRIKKKAVLFPSTNHL